MVIVFSVIGVNGQQTKIKSWKQFLAGIPRDNYLRCSYVNNKKLSKNYYYYKNNGIGYLAFGNKKSLLKLIIANEDYYKLLDNDFENIRFLTNNLLWISYKLWPNFNNRKKDLSEYRNVGMKYNSIHCNHYRLPDDTTGLRYEFKMAYSTFENIVQKMVAALE